jgi:PAS domain S-box-containing protein
MPQQLPEKEPPIGPGTKRRSKRRGAQKSREVLELFPLFMQHLPGAAFIKDPEGRYAYVNETWEATFRRRREDWLGKTDDELWPAEVAGPIKEHDRQVVEAQRPLQVLETMQLADSPHYWLVHRFPIPGPDGAANLVGGVAIEVTGRLQAEEALKKSRSFLEAVVEMVPGLIVLAAPDGRIALFNRACEELTGYRRPEVLGKNLLEMFLPPQWAPLVQKLFADPHAPEMALPHEIPWITKSGEERLIEWRHQPLSFIEDGSLFILGAGVDITARKRGMQALQESAERYRSLFQNNHAVMLLVNPETASIVDANPAACAFYGFTKEELTNRKVTDLNTLAPAQVAAKMQEARSRRGGQFDFRHRLASGEIRDVEVFSGPITIRGQELLYSIIHDITDRRRAEEAVREANEKLWALIQASPLAMIAVDADGKVMNWNPAAERLFGWRAEEVVGHLLPILPGDDALAEVKDLKKRVRGEAVTGLELRRRKRDGALIDISLSTAPLHDAAGHVTGSMGVLEDITSRKQAEEELRQAHEKLEQRVEARTIQLKLANQRLLWQIEERKEAEAALKKSEERFRALFQTAGSVIILLSPEGRILEVNQEAERLSGLPKDQILGKDALTWFIPDKDRPQVAAELARVVAEGSSRSFEVPLRLPDGTERLFLWNSTLIQGDVAGHPGGILTVGQDISERQKAEDALKAERQRFLSLLEELPAFVYLQAPDYTLPFVNRDFRERFGEPGGKRCYEILQGRDRPCENCQAQLAFATQQPQEWESSRGDQKTYQRYAYPFIDGDGSPLLLQMGIDITAHKQAKEALRDSEQTLRFLTSQLLTAQEQERRRISRELHDELGQALLVLKLQMSAIRDKLRKDQKSLNQDCQRSLDYLNLVIDNVRRLSRDLSPSTLEELGLSAAIKFLLNEFSKHYNIAACDYEPDEIEGLFPLTAQVNIYRIIQESLTNIGKHAGASQISLTIKKQDQAVAFRLEDNGKGFPVDEMLSRPGSEKGMGLLSIDERVRMLGGTLEIRSKPEAGTQITFSIPFREERGQ